MEWPAMSPDLNLIENLWAELKTRLEHHRRISNANQLFNVASRIWQEIPLDTIRNLFNSMPNRVDEVVRARGGHSHY